MIIEFNSEVAKAVLTWFCNQVQEVWQRMIQWISSKRDEIKAIMDEYMPVYDSPIHPAAKIKITKRSMQPQVIMRKPRFICARTSC